MITQEQLPVLPYVTHLQGGLVYPGGYPVDPEDILITTNGGETTLNIMERVSAYIDTCIGEDEILIDNPILSDDDFQVLRQWVIYMLHAPVYITTPLEGSEQIQVNPEGFERLKAKALTVSTLIELEEVAAIATEFGLHLL